MADNNVIDELQIKVSGSAKGAHDALNTLARKLESTANAVDKLEGKGAIVTDFANGLRKLESIDSGKIITLAKSLNTFGNSITKLSKLDLSKFDTSIFMKIPEGVERIANVKDVSASVNKLISSIAKLASAGENTRHASNALGTLGDNLKVLMGKFSSAGGIPAEITSFVNALGGLANAGNRTGATATQLASLGDALRQFMYDLQDAPMVSDNVIQMTQALGVLASSGGKAGTAARGIGKALNDVGEKSQKNQVRLNAIISIIKDIGNVFRRVGGWVRTGAQKIINALRQIKSAGNGLERATTSIKSMIGAMIGFRGITGLANVIKQTITLGANLTEIDHIVESVFGDMAGYADAWAKDAITQFGVAEHSAKQYAGTLSAMFQASGINYKDAGKMGMDLVGLAADLSSFYNIDTETAFNKVRSGMAGMVRPLRDLGIDLTAATLQEYALSQGITTSYSAMSQAEKVMLRYRYLMHVTEMQQGDFSRTNLSLANSMRTLKAYAQAVATQIGVGLGSAIRHVVVLLNQLMGYLLKAATAFATFMQTIFGKYKGGASGIAMEGLGDAADYADDLGDAAGGAADGLSDAADAAQELKKDLSVLPFDELNQLNKDQEKLASGGSGGAGGVRSGGVGGGGLLDWDDLIEGEGGKLPEAINAWAQQIKAAFQNHDWNLLGQIVASGLNKGLQKIYDVLDPKNVSEYIDPWIDAFTTSFNSLVEWFDWDLLGRTIGRGINDIVHILNRVIEGINWVNLGKKIAIGVNGLFSEIKWNELGNLVGNKLMALWQTIQGFVHNFGWEQLGIDVADFFNGVFEKVSFSDIADVLATTINGAFTSLAYWVAEFNWEDFATNVANGITTFISEIEWEKNAAALTTFLTNLCDGIINAIDKVPATKWEELGQGLADMLAAIPWRKILKTLGHVIVVALGGIVKGLLSEPEGTFAAAVVLGLTLFKISESGLGRFADHLVKLITGKTVSQILTTGFKKLFGTAATEAATSTTVATAGETAAKTATGGLATVGSVAAQLGLVGAGFAGAYVGITQWEKAIAKGIETADGGNGIITEFGGVVDHLSVALQNNKNLTKEQARQLFEIVEASESAGDSTETMAYKVAQGLSEIGVSTDVVNGALGAMSTMAYGSQDSFWALKSAVEGYGHGAKTAYNDLGTEAVRNEKITTDSMRRTSEGFNLLEKGVGEGASKVTSHLDKTRNGYFLLGQQAEETNTLANSEFMQIVEGMRESQASGSKVINDATTHLKTKSSLWSQYLGITKKDIGDTGDKTGEFEKTTDKNTNEVSNHVLGMVKSATGNLGILSKVFGDGETEVSKWKDTNKTSAEETDKAHEKASKGTIASMISMVTQTGLTILANKAMAESSEESAAKISSAFENAFASSMRASKEFVSAFESDVSTILMYASNLAGQIQATLSFSMFQAGQSAGYSFASGFSSVHIPTPYMYISAYDFIDFGNGGYMNIPRFNIGWYKAGGLFMGGNGKMIGIAEDNRDEAVLPLEDRRAMARIGSAIADAGGYGGNEQFANMVADRLAEVLIMSESERTIELTNNVIVKTEDDEVLARAVTRGQQKLDYRNNPTPSLAY